MRWLATVLIAPDQSSSRVPAFVSLFFFHCFLLSSPLCHFINLLYTDSTYSKLFLLVHSSLHSKFYLLLHSISPSSLLLCFLRILSLLPLTLLFTLCPYTSSTFENPSFVGPVCLHPSGCPRQAPLCSLTKLVSTGSILLLSFFLFLPRPQISFSFIFQLQNLSSVPRILPNFIFPLLFSSFFFFCHYIPLSTHLFPSFSPSYGCITSAFTVPLCPLHAFSSCCLVLPAGGLDCCNDDPCSCFSLPLLTISHLFFSSCFPPAASPPSFLFCCARPVSAASSSLFFCFRLSVASGLKQVFFKWVIMQKKKRDLRCRFSKFPPPFSWGFAKRKGFGEDYSTRTKEILVSNSCCCYLEFPSNNKLGEVGYGPVSNQTILHDGPLDSWLRWWCRLKVNNQYHE